MLKTLSCMILNDKLSYGGIKLNEKNKTICFEDSEIELSLNDRQAQILKDNKLFSQISLYMT